LALKVNSYNRRFQRPAWGTRRARSLASAIAAALLYGAWAFVVNTGHGVPRALRAGLTQALLSFVQTLLMTLLMETLFRLPRRPWVGGVLAASGALVVASTVSVTVHVVAGTPELLQTVAPVLSLGALFFVLYSLNLLRLARGGKLEAVRAAPGFDARGEKGFE
jgi:hypothetical protein